jgi:hypothetical protein
MTSRPFFDHLEAPIDHVMVTAGRPYYSRLADMDFDEERRGLVEHPMLMLGVARYAGRALEDLVAVAADR